LEDKFPTVNICMEMLVVQEAEKLCKNIILQA